MFLYHYQKGGNHVSEPCQKQIEQVFNPKTDSLKMILFIYF